MPVDPSSGLTTLDVGLLRRHAAELIERNSWPPERLLDYQRRQLSQALRHAVAASPYYRYTIGDLVARGAPLEELPVVTKRLLMEHFDRIVTDRRLSRALVQEHLGGPEPGALLLGQYRAAATGGTTGERGIFVYGDQAWLTVIASIARFQSIVGVLPTTRSVGIGAPSPIHLSPRFYAELRATRPNSPRLDLTMPVDRIVAALNAYQPEALVTYPSFLRVLVEEQRAGRLSIAPRIVRSGAETLTAGVRDLVRGVWNIPVIDSYASTEVGTMGQECGLVAGPHLAEDLCVFENVDERNRPVPAGARGAKLLVTTLTNRTIPLVRYELTDIVALTTEPCRCGLPFARLESIEGRREELLRFPKRGGGVVDVHAGRLSSPLLRMEVVRQFQFSQVPEGLEIAIAVVPGFDPEMARRDVESAVRATLGQLDAIPAVIRVRMVNAIERVGTGAKMKLVAEARPDSTG